MPAMGVICPDGTRTTLEACQQKCRMGDPCLSPETLKLVGGSRKWSGRPSITQLLNGTRYEFLKILKPFWIWPENRAFAILGTVHHERLAEQVEADEDELSERRFEDELKSGQSDRLQRLEDGTYLLWDYKTWGSYKVARFLGMTFEYIDDPSGATYKRTTTVGGRKFGPGMPKQVKKWTPNPLVANELEIALQMNGYRLLAEGYGYKVSRQKVQITVRDGDTVNARNNGIEWRMRSFPVPIMDDEAVNIYFRRKHGDLLEALAEDEMPPVCKPSERWDDRRCTPKFCEVIEYCDYGMELLAKKGVAQNESQDSVE